MAWNRLTILEVAVTAGEIGIAQAEKILNRLTILEVAVTAAKRRVKQPKKLSSASRFSKSR